MVGTPIWTSGKPNWARSEAMAKSQAVTRVSPKPSAKPLTAAMVGFQTSIPLSSEVSEGTSQKLCSSGGAGLRRSAPAEKARPLPVTIPTQASSSLRKVSQAAFRSPRSSWLIALSASGRL